VGIDLDCLSGPAGVWGGVYTAASLGWLWLVEGPRPDRWDLLGAIVCVGGAAIILWGLRVE